MLLSVGGLGPSARFLRPLNGVSYTFRFEEEFSPNDRSEGKMMELVILAESPDCPHPSLRQADGHFHTGDLFREITPGCYRSMGRNDDWIKSENGLRCDAKYAFDVSRASHSLLNLPVFLQSCRGQCPSYLCRVNRRLCRGRKRAAVACPLCRTGIVLGRGKCQAGDHQADGGISF
jgi:hypothetical protein